VYSTIVPLSVVWFDIAEKMPLATEEGYAYVHCRVFVIYRIQRKTPSVYRCIVMLFAMINNKYGFLTKCEVEVAGYWPSYFFLHVYGRDSKKIMRPIFSHYDVTSLVNKWFLGKFFFRDMAGSPEWVR